MAGPQMNSSSLATDFWGGELNPKEQDLLITALNSNTAPTSDANGTAGTPYNPMATQFNANKRSSAMSQRSQSDGSPQYSELPHSNQKTPASATLTNDGFDASPFLDNDLDESNFDWDLNADLIGGLPGASADTGGAEGDHGDKRKSPDEGEGEDGGGKRHEHEDKINKKPGRKPLTSEPTTKRKAQNRAAQRAFRERKEKHLKDLEVKVDDLERASEATNHENGLLRAQVDRLQTELREYRRRLSVNSNSYSRGSPTSNGAGSLPMSKRSWDINSSFQFDFPKFGGNEAQPKRTSSGSNAQDFPPLLTSNGFTNSMPSMSNSPGPAQISTSPSFNRAGSDDYSALFSPTTLGSIDSRNSHVDLTSRNGTAANSPRNAMGHNRRQNSAPVTAQRSSTDVNAASPASHMSNMGFASSSATTPESTADSPAQRKASEPATTSGAEELNGKASNHEDYSSTSSFGNQPRTPAFDGRGIDWLASQNGGAFDPVLFGDYRESQENVMNNDFLNPFFSDAYPAWDFGVTPQEKPLTPALPKKKGLMQEIEEKQAGKEPEVVLGKDQQHYLTCNTLWDMVQRSDKVQSGEADMDALCSELKAKAKCSGSGPVISQSDVDKILGPNINQTGTPDHFKMFR